ncbi:MAG: hypothetical protein APF78_05085 [Sphingomonadales bacterium BRH_c3]|nr:MAG: hypothetical protein APF78_05085 [Sphingomonadales bacterium BRH_c3]
MKFNVVFASMALLALTACATTEPGWSGQGATPFGEAKAACESSTAGIDGEVARHDAMTDCMASKGWTRG